MSKKMCASILIAFFAVLVGFMAPLGSAFHKLCSGITVAWARFRLIRRRKRTFSGAFSPLGFANTFVFSVKAIAFITVIKLFFLQVDDRPTRSRPELRRTCHARTLSWGLTPLILAFKVDMTLGFAASELLLFFSFFLVCFRYRASRGCKSRRRREKGNRAFRTLGKGVFWLDRNGQTRSRDTSGCHRPLPAIVRRTTIRCHGKIKVVAVSS